MVVGGEKCGTTNLCSRITLIHQANSIIFDMESKLFFPKESYDLVGCAYKVFNKLKFGYHEKYYQRAYAIELHALGYKCIRELPVRITYQGKIIGRYVLDFLINNLIVVEFKVGNDFQTKQIKQILSYLKATNRKLGLLILFSPEGIKCKRIVN